MPRRGPYPIHDRVLSAAMPGDVQNHRDYCMAREFLIVHDPESKRPSQIYAVATVECATTPMI